MTLPLDTPDFDHDGTDLFGSDTWADQLIFPPWIEDGHGVLFNEAFHDAGRDRSDSDRFALSPFIHSSGVSE